MPSIPGKSRFLTLLVCVSALLVVWLALPLAAALFVAAVAAVVLHPVHTRVARAFGGREALAGLTVTALATVLVGMPLAGVSALALREVADQAVTIARVYDAEGTKGLVRMVPTPLRPFARRIAEWSSLWAPAPAEAPLDGEATESAGDRVAPQRTAVAASVERTPPPADAEPHRLTSLAREAGPRVAAIGTWVTHKTLGLLLDCAIAILALFFLLVRGTALVHWAQAAAPLPQQQSQRLIDEVRDTARSVVLAALVTAVAQTAIATLGYVIAGVGALPLAVIVTLVASMIPVVGGAVVTCLVGVLQMLHGEVGWGLFLVAWGIVLVNLVENLLTPWICGSRGRVPSALVMFAIFGGIAVFGALGIVAGPIIVAFFRAVVEVARGQPSTRPA